MVQGLSKHLIHSIVANTSALTSRPNPRPIILTPQPLIPSVLFFLSQSIRVLIFCLQNADLLSETPTVRAPSVMPPLLQRLTERKPENLDYLGVSYGLTSPLLRWGLQLSIASMMGSRCADKTMNRFWKRAGYVPLYLRQTTSELTGEHTCVMLRGLNSSVETEMGWLHEFTKGEFHPFIFGSLFNSFVKISGGDSSHCFRTSSANLGA